MSRVRYPRTPHLPWSPGASSDDVHAGSLAALEGREIVVTEKLDGENTTLYRDAVHARSPDSAHHPSRAWVKALQGRIGPHIPDGWRICGENLFARHSIAYSGLESWFYAFSVWDDFDHCLAWDEHVRFARRLGLPTPPVLWRGVFDERSLRKLEVDRVRQEGYVVRPASRFAREDFVHVVAKWVRRGHVQTDEHWMLGPVVENPRGPSAAFWEVRSGVRVARAALGEALGWRDGVVSSPGVSWRDEALSDAYGQLDALGRTGDPRLAGALASMLVDQRRAGLMASLVAPVGMPLARRIADLVGLHERLHRWVRDEARRPGLVRMARAANLGVLHAVARSALPRLAGTERIAAREQVEWSELFASEEGLLGEDPFGPLREGLRSSLAGVDRAAADRCWAESLDALARGTIRGAEEAMGYCWRWRDGMFPRMVMTVGPSGSGKSQFVQARLGDHRAVSLDDLRGAVGERADQSANRAVLSRALHRLDEELIGTARVVWDATSINRMFRSLPLAIASRRDALQTAVVFAVPADVLVMRNEARSHRVPPDVLASQLERFVPCYPGDLHRTWYVDAAGTVADVADGLDGSEP